MAAWKGSTASAAQTARRAPPGPRVQWGQGGLPVLKGSRESEARLVRKVPKASPDLLGHRALQARPGLWVLRALPGLPVRKVPKVPRV